MNEKSNYKNPPNKCLKFAKGNLPGHQDVA